MILPNGGEPLRLVMLGLPGAGKGTQGELLARELEVPHISTGAIFREATSSDTPLGKKAQSFIDQGMLVPDEIAIEIVRQRLEVPDCRAGFILDGFPRTVPQALDLENALRKMGLPLNAAVNIRITGEEAVRRIAHRRVCSQCGATYGPQDHLAQADTCAECGGKLQQRRDDNEATARQRLEEYMTKTRPVVDFYLERGLLVDVNGEQDVHRVFQEITEALRVMSRRMGASGVAQ